jgi:hypothetical protein
MKMLGMIRADFDGKHELMMRYYGFIRLILEKKL